MAETGNRVEVRYGAFSCTIEGYDDPVGRMRDVLALMQRLISDTPALADSDTGIDDDRFARLDRALAERRAADPGDGTIIIRSGHRIAGDAEDAVILADDADNGEGEAGPPQSARGAPGPHRGAATHAAPAAAVAEAAFAASMANDTTDGAEGQAEAPPDEEVPGDTVNAAALYAAPAAEVAATAFSTARPHPGTETSEPTVETEVGSPAAAGDARAGSIADGHSPSEDDGASPLGMLRSVPGDREPVEGAPVEVTLAAEPLPTVNIFAPPANEAPPPWQDDHAGTAIAGRPEPLSAGHDEPDGALGAGTIDRDQAPSAAQYAQADDEGEAGDDPSNEFAGEASPETAPGSSWAEEPDDAAEDEAEDSTENRLAALITRYQSGMSSSRSDADSDSPTSGISAAELAERAGAAEVADLLAVSAAWLALAGGRAKFSRREVMEVFERLPGEHARTLEARIKGFGNLVRSGVLVLVEDGAFAMPPHERARFEALIDQR